MKKEKAYIPNTFGIQARADVLLEYTSEEELLSLIKESAVSQPCMHIGAGSNLLFLGDYKGTVLHSRISGIEVTDEDAEKVEVRVGAGVVWDDFVAHCVAHGWYGAENLSAIPGEVGAAAVQNIGAYGVEIKELITSVETIDSCGCKRNYRTDECAYAYRDSLFKRTGMKQVFVTRVRLRLSKQESYKLDYGTIRAELEKRGGAVDLHVLRNVITEIRARKLPDPQVLGNAGSFFKNPVVSRSFFEKLKQQYPSLPGYDVDSEQMKIPAGWMIEQCGWKGKKLGTAAVHDKQALVLVNTGGATGADIAALSDAVRSSVRQQFGIEIEPEVNFIGM